MAVTNIDYSLDPETYYRNALHLATSQGISFNSFFSVTINPSIDIVRLWGGEHRYFRFVCESAELPGRMFAVTSQKTYGPTQKYPIMSTFNDMTLSFMCIGNMYPKPLFESWLEYINPKNKYNFKFKNSYTAQITIEQYKVTGELIYRATIIDAFPVGILPQPLNFSSQNYHTLQIPFTYTEFTSETF